MFRTEHCLKGSLGIWIGRRFAPGTFTGTTTGKNSALALPVDSHFEPFETFLAPHPLVAAPSGSSSPGDAPITPIMTLRGMVVSQQAMLGRERRTINGHNAGLQGSAGVVVALGASGRKATDCRAAVDRSFRLKLRLHQREPFSGDRGYRKWPTERGKHCVGKLTFVGCPHAVAVKKCELRTIT